ncbi:hypothetical protein JCM19236_3591 [Vibrio sp. JCM 19236]|nr:hypothetical protein JCM19236_3591 [Vibrio sp. JCM 19236]
MTKDMKETRADQLTLLKNLLSSTNDTNYVRVLYAAWASALTTGSRYVIDLVKAEIDEPTESQRRDIEFAIARMGVTNPYFIAKQFVEVNAGGSLESLNFKSFASLNVEDEVAYHHACVAISLINGGHMCLRSHVGSLQQAGVPDPEIDATMRLAAVCHSLKILASIE